MPSLPVCHLSTVMSQLWAHRDICILSEKGTGRHSRVQKLICWVLVPELGEPAGEASTGLPEKDELAASHSLVKAPSQPLSGQAPGGEEPRAPSLAFPVSLFPPGYVGDSAPSPHLVTPGCMSQCTCTKMCVYLFVYVHALVCKHAGGCIQYAYIICACMQGLNTHTSPRVCLWMCIPSPPPPGSSPSWVPGGSVLGVSPESTPQRGSHSCLWLLFFSHEDEALKCNTSNL